MRSPTLPGAPPGPGTRTSRIRSTLSSHPAASGAIAVVVAGLLAFGLVWFEPWQLLVDRKVDDPLPGSPPATAPPAAGAPTANRGEAKSPPGGAASPKVLSTGSFRSLEHETTGTAKLLELPDGSRIVRFENLETSNGPDLVVLLSDTPADEDSWSAYDDGETLLLGELRGNVGNQNYEIPRGADLSRFRSVVVWCRRFTVGFGAAPLRAP